MCNVLESGNGSVGVKGLIFIRSKYFREEFGYDATENKICICDGEMASLSVTDGSWMSTGRLGTDLWYVYMIVGSDDNNYYLYDILRDGSMSRSLYQ